MFPAEVPDQIVLIFRFRFLRIFLLKKRGYAGKIIIFYTFVPRIKVGMY